MVTQQHPEDERLSALASHDDDATADAGLTSHVDSCARCTDLVAELGALRASLAQLPDLQPPRPLRLLPPVADAPAAAGGGGWVRRLFAPALTAGAALAMVGLIGTATPALDNLASSGQSLFQNVGSELRGGDSAGADGGEAAPAAAESDAGDASTQGGQEEATQSQSDRVSSLESADDRLPAERSPWPMVLFTGVALMIGAALLRWILVPRAG